MSQKFGPTFVHSLYKIPSELNVIRPCVLPNPLHRFLWFSLVCWSPIWDQWGVASKWSKFSLVLLFVLVGNICDEYVSGSLNVLDKILFANTRILIGIGRANRIMTFEYEVRGFESLHRRSASPLGRPLPASVRFLNTLLCTVNQLLSCPFPKHKNSLSNYISIMVKFTFIKFANCFYGHSVTGAFIVRLVQFW